ncbi:PREDICTED: uncharacterized protein LOC109581992 isoform X1 [Amphimedon queenslandica]|uniref:Uncharacterized protein n=1 Tax=Amphimedon queenslandica TaxID=400682 RepID=A0AAN0J5S3_AMPQE|nr:PREDICTED: uncharacterized protein LOC109581992 isoform X1 [Amphimedon queenslandica]|eukprot:XP_019852083.1 PREDICTED: uncharacterized protein LOC109581992 isoform X1 [Amphimedon queenslandica]
MPIPTRPFRCLWWRSRKENKPKFQKDWLHYLKRRVEVAQFIFSPFSLAFLHNFSSDWHVDEELVAAATASVQAQERFSYLLRSRAAKKPAAQKIADDSVTILGSLRDLKSRVEGTQFIFSPFSLDHNQLSLLHHLVVSHTPDNFDDGTKAKIAKEVTDIFDGQVKRLVYATILTCPWFSGSQSKKSAQPENNVLYVVFVSRDEQFFTLATEHEKELYETINEGFIFACDVRHFCAQLQCGNVRAVEALCSPPDSIIFSSPEWISLASLLDPVSLLTPTFVKHCVGKSIGTLIKKKPTSGTLEVRNDAFVSNFCDSFRLLSYAESAIKREPISSWFDVGVTAEEKEILQLLTKAFEGLVHKEQLLEWVLKVKERVDKGIEKVPTAQLKWTAELGEWMTKMRMEGAKFLLPQELESNLDPHRDFLDSQSLTSVHSRDVIVIAKTGSHMYNLAMPTSDTDYIVVYRKPTHVHVFRVASFRLA